MIRAPILLLISILKISLVFAGSANAASVHIAVASNFAQPLKPIVQLFEQDTGHKVKVSVGSTGKHFAQIRNGAPFDVFLAADRKRPELLEQQGLIVPESRFTYAAGRLAVWSPRSKDAKQTLLRGEFSKLAIANPRLAPYGLAAQQTLQHLGLWEGLRGRMVRGENIGQTFHFVHTGGAALGLVALAQLHNPDVQNASQTPGSIWVVPRSHHAPIEQQAVQVRPGAAAEAFLQYLRSEPARAVMQRFGYETGYRAGYEARHETGVAVSDVRS